MEFIVQDVVFKGENTSGTVLETVNTTIQIVNSTFKQFVGGNVPFYPHPFMVGHGDVIVAKASKINISQCKFENNGAKRGGVIYAERNSIVIIDNSIFTNNSAVIQGGVLYSLGSIVKIMASKFDNNMAIEGGVFFSYEGVITMLTSEFMINAAENKGGVLLSLLSNVTIKECKFNNNTVTSLITGPGQGEGGGVLYSLKSNIVIVASIFNGNVATIINGRNSFGCGGGVLNSHRDNITIKASKFNGNTAVITQAYDSGGGVLYCEACTITIERSEFCNNTATTSGSMCGGGVLKSIYHNNIIINASKFNDNTAITWGYRSGGGVLHSVSRSSTIITIEVSTFDNNSATTNRSRAGGGVLHTIGDIIIIKASHFNGNNAIRGAVIFSYSCKIIIDGCNCKSNTTLVNNNIAIFAVIYLIRDSVLNVKSSGNVMFSNNIGSLAAFRSDINFTGYVHFVSNHPETEISWTNRPTVIFQEGGAITLFHSNAHFKGKCTIQYNRAKNGGGLLSIMSKLYVYGDLIIAHNKASRDGGGGYLSSSELNCLHKSTLNFSNNCAEHKGGGLHAIGSFIKVWDSDAYCSCQIGKLYFDKNLADMGGGLSLEANAEIIILRYTVNNVNQIINFIANSAHTYGGAVYVDDNTNSGSMCTNDSKAECFFQVLALHSQNRTQSNAKTQYTYLYNNRANISGSALYGGLLDRCVVSQFAEIYPKDPRDGVAYLKRISLPPDGGEGIDFNGTISSSPVKVCLCIENGHNCSHQLLPVETVRKGAPFIVSVVAVDQIKQPVNANIHASLQFPESGLSEGQLTAEIGGECTDLTFNIVSPHEYEVLTLYAIDGPCKDADLSRRQIKIHFLPCNCPIGFQISGKTETNCSCDCHVNIAQYTEHCNSHTGSIIKKSQSRAWISYVNDINCNVSGYVVYKNCPFDYCNSQSLPIFLNQSDGADVQCAFNRSSLLCGHCKPGLSLSLDSSHCLQCARYWPYLLIVITLAAILAGIALVALLLLLNMTVAVGALNGLIFYVNVVHANRSILLPFQEVNAITAFVSWLNLGLGIDACYFPGMDANIKMWLQLAFPAYVILLVISVIIISSHSMKFSNLIGKKDPVATLATLILLSYAKIIEICFESLSVGTLSYPDGTRVPLWLPDATVKYLSGKHIPLFIAAVLILIFGLIYTALLFSWQWLLCLPDWKIFKWTRDQKLQTFIETHHAPFTPKHRYWTGLLLITRVILYLVAAANVSNDPHFALNVIIFTVVSILLLRVFFQVSLYRKILVNIFETFYFLNILFFCIFTECSLSNPDISQETVAYISVLTAFFELLLIIIYHMYAYTGVFSSLKKILIRPFRMAYTLLTRNNQDARRRLSLSLLHDDDDTQRVRELLDVIDSSANNEYREPLLTKKPMEACSSTPIQVEERQPYIPPPETENAKVKSEDDEPNTTEDS
jgi:predicted outer membrane repeat protein